MSREKAVPAAKRAGLSAADRTTIRVTKECADWFKARALPGEPMWQTFERVMAMVPKHPRPGEGR